MPRRRRGMHRQGQTYSCDVCGRTQNRRTGMKFDSTKPTLPRPLRPKVVPKLIPRPGVAPRRNQPVRQVKQPPEGIWRCVDLVACQERARRRNEEAQ